MPSVRVGGCLPVGIEIEVRGHFRPVVCTARLSGHRERDRSSCRGRKPERCLLSSEAALMSQSRVSEKKCERSRQSLAPPSHLQWWERLSSHLLFLSDGSQLR